MTKRYHIRPTRIDFGQDTIQWSDKLPAGIYNVGTQMYGPPFLIPKKLNTDELVSLPSSIAERIRGEVDQFLRADTKAAFDRYGIIYKRGLLMYGAPGTGKTCIIHEIVEDAIAKGMIVLMDVGPGLVKAIVEEVRGIEDSPRPFLIIWEEFENVVEDYEPQLLGLLDGMEQMDNMFFIATTNYIDQIPPRIKNRPSRFADIMEVGPPEKEAREAYLRAKIHPKDNVDISQWVKATEGLNIDQIKDVVISSLVLQLPLEQSVAKIKAMGDLCEEDE